MKRRTFSAIAAFSLLWLSAGNAFAQRELKDIPPTDPEIERKALQLADGLEINLFAADPLLAKPIHMNFDAEGRLWVATSELYPQIQPGQKANDKIVVLTDADGDGKAEKTSVFADGLLIPTGVEPGDGGVYVANSTELVHLRDSDGDGKADQSRIVLSGFGTEDTHHILHTLRWGHDGMLYFNQSIYIHSHIETPYGPRRLAGGGVWQFRPETMQLEIFIKGLVNSWGHTIDRWGQSFGTDGAGGEGINYFFPGAVYFTSPGATRILQGLNPGSPKHCGAEIVSGRHLPDDWQGNIITNDFRAHRVCRFVLSDDGSGYSSQQQVEVVKSEHVGFRPVDVKIGPDGAIYIADWYNPIIQHGEVDFRDPRRDHTHGRIWRITFKNRPLVKRPQLVKASVPELLNHLKAPEDWTRHHAKLQLKARGKEAVLPELEKWLKSLDAKDPQYVHQRLEGLWTYQALNVPQPKLLAELLNDAEPRARAAAVRVASQWQDRLDNPLALLAPTASDDHPRVRLEGVRALGAIPDLSAAEAALRALDKPMDRFLDFGLWLTSRELEPIWMAALQKGEFDFRGRIEHLTFALQAVGSPAVVKPLVALLEAGKITPQREESILSLIAGLGGPEELALVYNVAQKQDKPASVKVQVLSALAQAARQRKQRPAGDLKNLEALLLNDKEEAVQAEAARLAGLWKVDALAPSLNVMAASAKSSDRLKLAVLDGLAAFATPGSAETIHSLTDARFSPEVRMKAAQSLLLIDVKKGTHAAVEVLASLPKGTDVTPLYDAIIQRKNGPEELAAALNDKKLPADTAKVGLRLARSMPTPPQALIAALSQAGNISTETPTVTPEELAQLVEDVKRQGDPAKGETIFRRKDLSCMKCHAIGGAGGQVGPDLISIGASAQIDYLVESILLPSKAVKENYHSLVVSTTDGNILSGIKVREANGELVLRNAEDQEVAIPLGNIDERAQGNSLMPVGLTETLTRDELVHLVRFMSELGKVGPYAVERSQVVRRWQVLDNTQEGHFHIVRTGFESTAANSPQFSWLPGYSTVAGTLPTDAIPLLTFKGWMGAADKNMGFARFQVSVSTGGEVKLKFNDVGAMSLWVDGAPIKPALETKLTLPQGNHTVTVAVEKSQRKNGLRCELIESSGSLAKAQFIGGK